MPHDLHPAISHLVELAFRRCRRSMDSGFNWMRVAPNEFTGTLDNRGKTWIRFLDQGASLAFEILEHAVALRGQRLGYALSMAGQDAFIDDAGGTILTELHEKRIAASLIERKLLEWLSPGMGIIIPMREKGEPRLLSRMSAHERLENAVKLKELETATGLAPHEVAGRICSFDHQVDALLIERRPGVLVSWLHYEQMDEPLVHHFATEGRPIRPTFGCLPQLTPAEREFMDRVSMTPIEPSGPELKRLADRLRARGLVHHLPGAPGQPVAAFGSPASSDFLADALR